MAEVQLFGGAITCLFPAEFEDISSIRQVPDHQEVYVHRGFDSSFIVEVLEYVQDKPYAGDALLASVFARAFVKVFVNLCRSITGKILWKPTAPLTSAWTWLLKSCHSTK